MNAPSDPEMAAEPERRPSERVFFSRLTLRRFRSHDSFDFEADARPVAIFGPNGAGKTNILESISVLAPGRGLRGAKAEEMAGRPDPIGWSVKARLESGGGGLEIAAQCDLRPGGEQGKRRLSVGGEPASQTALAQRLRALWLTPAMDRLWIEGASERRKFLDRLTLAFEPGHGAQVAEYERAMRERNRLLKDMQKGASVAGAWLDALEQRMGEAGAALTAARLRAIDTLGASQDEGDAAFPKADLDLVPAEGDLVFDAAGPLIEAMRRSRRADAAAGRSLVGPHRDDLGARYAAKGVEARLASTGEQKALLISIVLAAARALASSGGTPPILLLDEIAAHLDDGRRAALYDELTTLKLQAWLTGTGPELFSALGERAQSLELKAPEL